jgi:acyl-CoA thioesterase FadM
MAKALRDQVLQIGSRPSRIDEERLDLSQRLDAAGDGLLQIGRCIGLRETMVASTVASRFFERCSGQLR